MVILFCWICRKAQAQALQDAGGRGWNRSVHRGRPWCRSLWLSSESCMGCAKVVRRGGSWDDLLGLEQCRQFFRSHVSSFRLLMRGDFGSQYVDRQKTGERKEHSSRLGPERQYVWKEKCWRRNQTHLAKCDFKPPASCSSDAYARI